MRPGATSKHLAVPVTMLLVTALLSQAYAQPAPTTPATAQAVRYEIDRRLGVWLTSNDRYRTAENGEAEVYGTHFRAALGGVATTGCLWGQTGDEVLGVYWHFFTGWDPGNETMIVYQSSAGGLVGIGREPLTARGAPSIVDQTFAPLPGDGPEPFLVRHRTTWMTPDSMRTESFDRVDGLWQPRRNYVWVRQADGVTATPC